ncbi:hypothetical protein [Lewinella sp. W8]|uniref:hypothetical protein n=1 Tax=Lewinella sp. W8 TaxID=2528208 RepID=UPI001068CC4D|nr:hypothetical protein [Lewinella sp. W8]MTB50838.1 hypothetical protein [Lewinella sp. W8]
MRILGRLDHPVMQITVFENDGRFPVQFELGGLRQTFRFRKSASLNNFGDVKRMLDDAFIDQVLEQFRPMQRIQSALLNRQIQEEQSAADELPDII